MSYRAFERRWPGSVDPTPRPDYVRDHSPKLPTARDDGGFGDSDLVAWLRPQLAPCVGVRHCIFSDARAIASASVGRGIFAKCTGILCKFRKNTVVPYTILRHPTACASKAHRPTTYKTYRTC